MTYIRTEPDDGEWHLSSDWKTTLCGSPCGTRTLTIPEPFPYVDGDRQCLQCLEIRGEEDPPEDLAPDEDDERPPPPPFRCIGGKVCRPDGSEMDAQAVTHELNMLQSAWHEGKGAEAKMQVALRTVAAQTATLSQVCRYALSPRTKR